MTQPASFTAMADGSRADFEHIDAVERAVARRLPERVLAHLQLLDTEPTAFPISRYQHSLQSATRALRDDQDEETVVAALLHDIGDTLAPFDHGALAAAILRPYVSERLAWIVAHHGLFQGYWFFHHLGGDRHARDRFADHPWFDDAHQFCLRYDQCAFDPGYDTLPIDVFAPMVQRVLAEPCR